MQHSWVPPPFSLGRPLQLPEPQQRNSLLTDENLLMQLSPMRAARDSRSVVSTTRPSGSGMRSSARQEAREALGEAVPVGLPGPPRRDDDRQAMELLQHVEHAYRAAIAVGGQDGAAELRLMDPLLDLPDDVPALDDVPSTPSGVPSSW